MNPDTFFENFDLLADAPNGVQKLREMILQLAVSGKLVPQNPDDEPAAVLLERIRTEKERLVKQGKIKKSEPLPEVKPDEAPFKIPNSWEWQRLETLFYSISSSNKKIKSKKIIKNGAFPVVDQGKQYISGYSDESNKVIKIPGPVLIFGDHTREIKIVDFDFIAGADGIKILRPIVIFEKYFYYVLRSLNIESRGYSRHYKILLSQLFPLPPLAEQTRIVAKVDQLMALCDELEAKKQKRNELRTQVNVAAMDKLLSAREPGAFNESWRRIAENFDLLYDTPETVGKLRQAILQLAVSGKLVPQNPADEPASLLLERIRTEKERLIKQGKIKKSEPLPPVRPDEAPYDLPDGWEWASINHLSKLVTDGEHATPPRIHLKEIPLATAKNVRNGYLDLSNTDFVSNTTALKCWSRCKPQDNDILMVCVGATTGRLCVVKDPPDMVLVRSVALFRFMEHIFPEYIAIVLRSPLGQNQIWGNVKQSAQPCLYLHKISALQIPVPPINEQTRIVAKVDQLMALCDSLETKLARAGTGSETLITASIRNLIAA